jgi:predicted RNA binding protein with dsRBD fold (UPF0201 family)
MKLQGVDPSVAKRLTQNRHTYQKAAGCILNFLTGAKMSNRIQSLDIPDEEQETLASLAKLKDSTLLQLASALRELTPTLVREDLLSQLRQNPALKGMKELDSIVRTLINIAGTAYSAGIDASEVVDAVIETIKSEEVTDLSDEDAKILRKRLNSLEKTDSISLVAKASELLKASERVFHSGKINSDLRPVCLREETTVGGAVVVHQLAVRSVRNGRREYTYFALDSLDLKDLGDTIARAIKKDSALRELAACSKLPVLSPPVK